MTKISYPVNGIYNECGSNAKYCRTYLNNATAWTGYTVPNHFYYATTSVNLRKKVKRFYKEMNDIVNKLYNTSKTLEELELDMTEKSKAIGGFKLAERDRMIF